MQEIVRSWLGQEYPELVEFAPLQAGLGSTTMWTFRSKVDEARLVVRLYPSGATGTAEREAAAMEAARAGGVPVPVIRQRGTIGDRPVLVTDFVPGTPARDLLTDPVMAGRIGRAMGEVFGALHQVIAPNVVRSADRHWLEVAGAALDPIRDRLWAVPNQERLVHLDFHPLNVLVEDEVVTGVIDWENARAAPPHMDLARSRAILRSVILGGLVPPGAEAVFARFESALIAGHEATFGPDPHPELSLAWGLAMTTADLEAQASKPGSPISAEMVSRLAAERDAAITRAAHS